jgi:hypothetical protein
MFYQHYLAVRNTADVTGGKPIAVIWSQSILGVSPVIPLVAFYDIHGRKRGVILLFCPGHHTRQKINQPLRKLLSFHNRMPSANRKAIELHNEEADI